MATSQPSNASELQLFRVLQRANLLQYYDTFITQGGDDVQQLCEAGEDEFLEIMALVGMASKPLHVRRLQKALQEWVANPAAFETNTTKKFPTHVMSMIGSTSRAISPSHSIERSGSIQDFKMTPPQSSTISTSTPWSIQGRTGGISPSEGSNQDQASPTTDSQETDYKDIMKEVLFTHESPGQIAQPALMDHQITAIASSASLLARELPSFEPKSMPKKQISKEIHAVMMMSADDPRKMDALRKYAAIYGRFDSKRKNDRPMSLHEISVNEAAAQLCSHFPALLTRREELFPLARQVVRDSGYQYSKGHSRPLKTDHGKQNEISKVSQRAAEVIVPPKSEPPDDDARDGTPSIIPASSSLLSQEETYYHLQSELGKLNNQLSELVKEQDRIRSALRVLLETDDHQQMHALTAEMDDLNDQQTEMTARRQDLIKKISKLKKSIIKQATAVPASMVVGSFSRSATTKFSPSSSTSHYTSSNSTSYREDLSTNPLNTLYMAALHNTGSQDSLFEEGLRIATQYGMSDFAEELKGMKSKEKSLVEMDAATNGMKNQKGSTSSTHTATTMESVNKPASSLSSAHSPSALSVSSGSTGVKSPLSNLSYTAMSLNSPSSGLVTLSTAAIATTSSLQSEAVVCSKHAEKASATAVFSPIQGENFSGRSNSTQSSHNSSSTSNASPKYSVSLSSAGTNHVVISSVDSNEASGSAIGITAVSSPSMAETNSTPVSCTALSPSPSRAGEVEMRRSSRRKNGDPDYYLINGGEKRFRSGYTRRSSSTSSERGSKTPSVSSSPNKLRSPSDSNTSASDDGIHVSITDVKKRNSEKLVVKSMVDGKQLSENQESVVDETVNGLSSSMDGEHAYCHPSSEPEKRIMRRKTRTYHYVGRHPSGEYTY